MKNVILMYIGAFIMLLLSSCDNGIYTEGYSKIDKYEVSAKEVEEVSGKVSHTYYNVYVRNNVNMLEIDTDQKSYGKVKVHDSILVVNKTVIRTEK